MLNQNMDLKLAEVSCSLLPAPCSLLPASCSLLPAPCSLIPDLCSLISALCSLLSICSLLSTLCSLSALCSLLSALSSLLCPSPFAGPPLSCHMRASLTQTEGYQHASAHGLAGHGCNRCSGSHGAQRDQVRHSTHCSITRTSRTIPRFLHLLCMGVL
jgi:hypothetical protein